MSDTANPHSTNSHLAHHFDSAETQFSASKLGMWIFLGTEVLLFSGLFCVYAVYRANHPEIFALGHLYLDRNWGALNTIVLILSSLTMALAVSAAQSNQKRELVVYLSLTLLLAIDFLGVKTIEYTHKISHHLVGGVGYYAGTSAAPSLGGVAAGLASTPVSAPVQLLPGDLEKGKNLFKATCAGCHGQSGQGMPGLGKDMRNSEFIKGSDEPTLVAFLLKGRLPDDPANTTGKLMPARGGNPALKDQDLADIVAFVHKIQMTAKEAGPRSRRSRQSPAAVETTVAASTLEPVIIEKSFIPKASEGPPGLAVSVIEAAHIYKDPHLDPDAPKNLPTFFAIYFLLTGLHGIHVLIGMSLICWLLWRAVNGDFNATYFTPVDLGGLYWHLVDLIWIFLFPLLYLIK